MFTHVTQTSLLIKRPDLFGNKNTLPRGFISACGSSIFAKKTQQFVGNILISLN